jgi:glycine cleavage system T protein
MTEATETEILTRSPFDAIHRRLGATMVERDGWAVPAAYGDVRREYEAVREGGAGLFDLSSRGRIQVSGTEAVQFLNGLITNDMKTLAVNHWMPAAFPNVQGRLIAIVRVVRLKDEGTGKTACPAFLIDTEAATHAAVLKNIERFTLAGDFRVTDVTHQTALISVQGSKAADVVRAVMGETAAALEANEVFATTDVTVIRSSPTAELGFDLLVTAEQANSLWERLQAAGAEPVGFEALEILRIEAGLPRYGVDMDETNVVTETGLDEAVSYTKGCYVGQEIIARIKYRGHVAKKLSGLLFAEGAKAEAGATIKSTDGKDIGRITSITFSPQLQRTIALGYLKFDYLSVGTVVSVISGSSEVEARVMELPFLRPTTP